MEVKNLLIAFCLVFGGVACRDGDDVANLSNASEPTKGRISLQWPKGREFIKIPVEFLDGIPVVKCELNGKASVFYIDTGSNSTFLYQDRLDRFGIKLAEERDYRRYTGGGRMERTSFSGEFILGFGSGLEMKVSEAPCLPGIGRDPGHDVDGILGSLLLKSLNAVIDLRENTLLFSPEIKPSKSVERTGASPRRSDRE